MTIHLLAYPFSETNSDWSHCAYTSRTRDTSTMFTRAGIETILYSGGLNDAECSEHVAVMTPDERSAWWPDYNSKRDVSA